MAVTTEIGSRGTLVLIEPETQPGLDRRVFRQVGVGYEWAHLSDWRENGERARFYGYAPRELPDSMRAL